MFSRLVLSQTTIYGRTCRKTMQEGLIPSAIGVNSNHIQSRHLTNDTLRGTIAGFISITSKLHLVSLGVCVLASPPFISCPELWLMLFHFRRMVRLSAVFHVHFYGFDTRRNKDACFRTLDVVFHLCPPIACPAPSSVVIRRPRHLPCMRTALLLAMSAMEIGDNECLCKRRLFSVVTRLERPFSPLNKAR